MSIKVGQVQLSSPLLGHQEFKISLRTTVYLYCLTWTNLEQQKKTAHKPVFFLQIFLIV